MSEEYEKYVVECMKQHHYFKAIALKHIAIILQRKGVHNGMFCVYKYSFLCFKIIRSMIRVKSFSL